MGARISPGFTIIETVLFLAVTGLLIMGVLIGTSSSLNTQRYRDSVESFKDLLQTQYAELGSVKNSRPNTWNCNAAAGPQPSATPGQIRGQSDCLLVGRYMQVKGNEVAIYPVLAHQMGTASGTDVAKLDANYAYHIDTSTVDTSSLEWGSQIAWPKAGAGARVPATPRSIGILFIRSPDSGRIYTFTSDNTPDEASINQGTFTEIIAAGMGIPGQGGRTMCIVSSGLASAGDNSVYLSSNAASASAVEIRSNAYILSISGTTQC